MIDAITIVSGLPRSGTSAMMQMLAAGGMSIVTDGLRAADEDNPRGYFELERVKQLGRGGEDVLADLQGRAVKIISALLYRLPRGRYQVIVMRRRLDEVLASQREMLRRRGVATRDPDGEVGAALQQELVRLEGFLAARDDMAALWIEHRALLAEPRAVAERVNAFVGGGLDVAAMAAAIDPALHRQRH